MLSVLFACLLAVSASSTLPDESSVVATDVGLYLVLKGQPAQLVLTPPFLGLASFNEPSVTWLPGTDDFILTSRGTGTTGRLVRVTVTASGSATFVELTNSVPVSIGRDFADADYSLGLDTLFVVNRNEGLVWAWAKPGSTSAASAVVWAALTPSQPISVAVNGAHSPFSLIVAQRTDPVVRVMKSGVTVLNTTISPQQVACNGTTGEWYAAVTGSGFVGVPFNGVGIDFNASGFCGSPAKQPEDVQWDPVARRAVALGGDGAGCIDNALPTGTNHIVRLPLAASGGPPSNKPVLLTANGPSGIDGIDGDLAYVRHGGGDLTWFGSPGVSGAGLAPEMDTAQSYGGAPAIGKAFSVLASQAPPSAPATLVIGVASAPVTVQGQLLVPALHLLVPLMTDASGDATLPLAIPNDNNLVGLVLYMQWWFSDTTTPQAGDLVSTQTAITAIGLK